MRAAALLRQFCRGFIGKPFRPPPRQDPSPEIRLLACAIMERRTGMPSYLVDDETAEAAYAEAEATYVPPEPLLPVQEAVRKASGRNPTADEIATSIDFLNRAAAAIKGKRP